MESEQKHVWICEDCRFEVEFRQPELSQDDPRSEQNEGKNCPICGFPMYFDSVEDF